MTTEPANGGSTFSQKEMLVRIDAKVDVIAAKQQGYDVELAIVKERANQHDANFKEHIREEETTRKETLTYLQGEIEAIRSSQTSVKTLVKWTTAVLAGFLVASDVLIRFFAR